MLVQTSHLSAIAVDVVSVMGDNTVVAINYMYFANFVWIFYSIYFIFIGAYSVSSLWTVHFIEMTSNNFSAIARVSHFQGPFHCAICHLRLLLRN